MQRIRQIFPSIIAISLAAIPTIAQRIDLPRNLPTPFGIELGKPFEPGEKDALSKDHEAFEVYEVTPPNPIEHVSSYKIWKSKRYGIAAQIEASTTKSANGTGGFFDIKEMLEKSYAEPREPTKEEWLIYYHGFNYSSLERYDFKYYWKMDGWHIVMFTRNNYAGKLIFSIDRAVERSFKFAPKP